MINSAYAMGGTPPAQGGAAPPPLLNLMPIVLIFGIFYFLLIRPQQKRQAEHGRMVSQLKKNDQVITTGGIYGTIVNVKEDSVVLRVDDNVRIEVQKNCVASLKKQVK